MVGLVAAIQGQRQQHEHRQQAEYGRVHEQLGEEVVHSQLREHRLVAEADAEDDVLPRTRRSFEQRIVLETHVQGARLGDELALVEDDEVDGDQRHGDGGSAEGPGSRLDHQVDQHQHDPGQAEGQQHRDLDDARAERGVTERHARAHAIEQDQPEQEVEGEKARFLEEGLDANEVEVSDGKRHPVDAGPTDIDELVAQQVDGALHSDEAQCDDDELDDPVEREGHQPHCAKLQHPVQVARCPA